MAWNAEYTKEFNALMDEWGKEIQKELEKTAPTRGIVASGKGKTDAINDKYKVMLSELKVKYGIM